MIDAGNNLKMMNKDGDICAMMLAIYLLKLILN